MRVSRIHKKNKVTILAEDVINNIMDFFAKPLFMFDEYIDSKKGLELNE